MRQVSLHEQLLNSWKLLNEICVELKHTFCICSEDCLILHKWFIQLSATVFTKVSDSRFEL